MCKKGIGCLITVACLFLFGCAEPAAEAEKSWHSIFFDDFNRNNSTTIGNGWVAATSWPASGASTPKPEISGNQLVFSAFPFTTSTIFSFMPNVLLDPALEKIRITMEVSSSVADFQAGFSLSDGAANFDGCFFYNNATGSKIFLYNDESQTSKTNEAYTKTASANQKRYISIEYEKSARKITMGISDLAEGEPETAVYIENNIYGITTIQGTLWVESAMDIFSFDNFRIEEYR